MRLLLAEDEKALSDTLKILLKKNCYEVDAVYDGDAALEHIQNGYYDGIIMDVMMPGMDGITVIRTIREKGNISPVLLLTARTEIEDRVCGLDSGANDYLPKPFDTRELLARIRAMLRNGETLSKEAVQTGNIKLDRSTMEMCSRSGSFRLSAKEFEMMKVFMSHPGSNIPASRFEEKTGRRNDREDICAAVAYVLFLNRKLDALGANVHINEGDNDCFRLEVNEIDG